MIVLRYQSPIRASRGHTVNNYDLFRKPGILNNKLQQNLRINADELQKTGKGKERVPVRMVGPLVEIKLMPIYKLFQVQEKQSAAGQVLIEVKNFGRVYGEVTKKIHFILTSVARDGRSDFSIISMYQTSRCRYFYSQDKDGWEIKTYLERLFAEESGIFIGVSPEDDFLNILSFEGKKEVLSEKNKAKNVAHVKNLESVKEPAAINSLETLQPLEAGK